jgi:hypothetical protein
MVAPNLTKTCSKCKAIKSLNDFSAAKTTKDGYQYWCKSCQQRRLTDIRDDPERHAKQSARHLAAQRERMATKEGRAKKRAWETDFRASPEGKARLKKKYARWASSPKGKETLRRNKARFYAKNKERLLAKMRAYRKKHNEKCKLQDAKRRATALQRNSPDRANCVAPVVIALQVRNCP